MQVTLTIPDALVTEFRTAVKSHNTRMVAENQPTLDAGDVKALLLREVRGWLANFILAETALSLEQEKDDLLAQEGDRLMAL